MINADPDTGGIAEGAAANNGFRENRSDARRCAERGRGYSRSFRSGLVWPDYRRRKPLSRLEERILGDASRAEYFSRLLSRRLKPRNGETRSIATQTTFLCGVVPRKTIKILVPGEDTVDPLPVSRRRLLQFNRSNARESA